LREKILIIRNIGLVLLVGSCRLIDVGNKRRATTSNELCDRERVTDANDIFDVQICFPNLGCYGILIIGSVSN